MGRVVSGDDGEGLCVERYMWVWSKVSTGGGEGGGDSPVCDENGSVRSASVY